MLGEGDGTGGIITTVKIEPPASSKASDVGLHSDLGSALAATVDYVLGSQNTNAESPSHNRSVSLLRPDGEDV